MASDVSLSAQTSEAATKDTVNELLDRLSLPSSAETPKELVTIERQNIVCRVLDTSDDVLESGAPDWSMEEFVYDDLVEGDFRLMKLSGSSSGDVQIQLDSFPLSSPPPYFALSYKWQEESELRRSMILCNKRRFMLSPDLLTALQRIWLWQSLVDDDDESVMFLWNDFTCIDQRNVEERQRQVARMADVYTGAKRAVVWLGPGDRMSNLAFLSMPGIIDFAAHSGDVLIRGQEDLKGTGLENMGLWQAVGRLFHKSWFERLWVLQEVVLAPAATVMCGDIVVDWSVVNEFVMSLTRIGLLRLASGEYGWRDKDDKSNGLMTVMDVENLKRIGQDFGQIWSVPHLMDVAWGKQCLEPVDRVWAVVGLLPDMLRENLFAQRFVDYSEHGRKHYEETYSKTAKWLIEIDLSGMLSMAARSVKSDRLPSWCPDWSTPPRCSNLGMSYHTAGVQSKHHGADEQRHEDDEPADNVPDFDKATGTYVSWTWEHNVLKVAGFRVDAIDELTEDVWEIPPSSEDDISLSMNRMVMWLVQAISLARSTQREGEDWFPLRPNDTMRIPERFWRTLTGGRDFTPQGSSVERSLMLETPLGATDGKLSSDDFLACLNYMLSMIDGGKGEQVDNETYCRAMRFRSVVDAVCTGRKLATTMHRRLAIVPPDTERGDIVCIFYGGWVPYMLRSPRNGKLCRFIGDAYIEGLMHGESLTFKTNMEGPLQSDERGLNELFPMV